MRGATENESDSPNTCGSPSLMYRVRKRNTSGVKRWSRLDWVTPVVSVLFVV